jgi:hypothetical protein
VVHDPLWQARQAAAATFGSTHQHCTCMAVLLHTCSISSGARSVSCRYDRQGLRLCLAGGI